MSIRERLFTLLNTLLVSKSKEPQIKKLNHFKDL